MLDGHARAFCLAPVQVGVVVIRTDESKASLAAARARLNPLEAVLVVAERLKDILGHLSDWASTRPHNEECQAAESQGP